MAFAKYRFRVVSYDAVGGVAVLLWDLEDVQGSDPHDESYTPLNPFDPTGLSWNLYRKYWSVLLGSPDKGIPERLSPGSYLAVDGTFVTIDRDDLCFANLQPSGTQFRGLPFLSSKKQTFYRTLTVTYRADTYTPPTAPLDDPRLWSIPSPDGDATKCLGGGGTGGGGGASGEWGFVGKSTSSFPGECAAGSGAWNAIYSYNAGGNQSQYVHIAYFNEVVESRWSSWIMNNAMMQTDPAGYATNGGDIWARVYNMVKAAGFKWYQVGINDDDLADYDYQYGPITVYPQGWFLYARGCPTPNIDARTPEGEPEPPPWPWPTIIIHNREDLAKAARLGVDLRPYDLMFLGNKLTFEGEQVTCNDPEAGE